MKKALLIFMALAMTAGAANASRAILSPGAYKLKEASAGRATTPSKELPTVSRIGEVECAYVLAKVDSTFDFAKAGALGVTIGTRTKRIITASVPVDKFAEFVEMPGLIAVEAESISAPHLDVARTAVKADLVKAGASPLPKAYTGKGVIVGVIDAGFDYAHPAFYDFKNKKIRITHVWEQGTEGTRPYDFKYGRELKTEADILASGSDHKYFSHGSHVTGICAGSPEPTSGLYEGMAPEAEICLVGLKMPRPSNYQYETAAANFIDAYSYLFKYADEAGKPIAVNLSWGLPIDSKDGESLFSQALDDMVGKGKIAALSAGNDGDSKIGALFDFQKDSTMFTYTKFPTTMVGSPKRIWFDLWGDKDQEFSVSIGQVSMNDWSIMRESGMISSASDKDTVIHRAFYPSKDTAKVDYYLYPTTVNGKSHMAIQLECNYNLNMGVYVHSTKGQVHMFNWSRREDGYFTCLFGTMNNPKATDGTVISTISDWACGKRVVGVGAVASKLSIVNEKGYKANYNNSSVSGQTGLNDIAFFSSLGPTYDGRFKPDVCAPGFGVVSSVNSLDTAYFDGGIDSAQTILRVSHNNKLFPYAWMPGTSMSSPVVTGCIALMLEADPTLTPERVLDYIAKRSITDEFTGTNLPNNTWGHGKFNLFSTVKDIMGVLAADFPDPAPEIVTYPNPALSSFSITPFGEGYAVAELYDALGNKVLSAEIDASSPVVNLSSSFSPGAYYVRVIKDGKEMLRSKLLVGTR